MKMNMQTLAAPTPQRTLYIDIRRCMGCRACETVCKLENDLPAGPRYTMVTEVETGEGLEKEIEHYYYDNFAFISSAHTPTMDIVSDIANHFYELGQRDAANKFDEIEYNRQRAGQEMLDKTLVVAAEESAISQYSMSEIDEELDVVHSRILHEIGFKAGAKWMAGQGVTLKVTDDTTWGEVNDFIHRNCDGVKEIQIRKKEESK